MPDVWAELTRRRPREEDIDILWESVVSDQRKGLCGAPVAPETLHLE